MTFFFFFNTLILVAMRAGDCLHTPLNISNALDKHQCVADGNLLCVHVVSWLSLFPLI